MTEAASDLTPAPIPAPASGDAVAPWRILCVDDEANILSALRRLFRQNGYQISVAGGGAEGLQILVTQEFDLIISDMRMPEMDGARFLEQVFKRYPDTVRILLTGYADIASTIEAVNKGQIYRYVSKPWNDQELLLIVRQALDLKALQREKLRLEALTARQNEELKALNLSLEEKVQARTQELALANEKLKGSFITSVKVFSNLIELREGNLAGHSRRVADLARKIANKLGMTPRETQDVFLAGLMHDIGKIGLSDHLLAKAVTQMSGDDLGAYRKHPVKGEQSLMALEELRGAAKIIRAHHERFDGQGYPDALAGLSISLGARVLAVANDYDGLQIGIVAPRRLSPEDARKMIANGRGKRYDPTVVDAFLAVLGGVEPERTAEIAVPVADLKPGMVLSRDLMTRDGVLLLAADYLLDASLIRQIRDYATTDGGAVSVFIRNDRR
ncbi:MAG: response regulator [Propionivibrio sp.]|uniref:HD domain-containing phosphohydrolase n=1 Tax=Propionivibrio sp. TaxID=2212460 RepID=UPI001A52D7FA|nr:HD domain-containing phosphohydrolase [Propionivibrio sp.]MBL8414300.1 response regulator [Propionivibrio sp.]